LRRLVHRAPGQLSPQPLHNMARHRDEVGQKSGRIRRYRAANSDRVRKLMTGPDEGRCQERKTAMLRHLRVLDRRFLFPSAVILPLCLALPACGGGGTEGVAATSPPPPAPKPAVTLDVKTSWLDFMGTHDGTYGLMGTVTLTPGTAGSAISRALVAGEASMAVARQNGIFAYTLSAAPGILSTGATSIAFSSPEISWGATNDPVNPQIFEDDQNGALHEFLGQRLVVYRKSSDGSEEEAESYDFSRGTSRNGPSSFTYDIGSSYVAMGEWASSSVQPGAAPAAEILFVNGDRTPPSGIPASGTATYNAHTLTLLTPAWDDSVNHGINFTLTANFGVRTIATQINQDYHHYTEQATEVGGGLIQGAILGIHVSGSAPFGDDGSFDIPLTGTANYSATNAVTTPPSEPVTGAMNGAFFGPNAEEVGGTFSLNRASGLPPIQDAFVGQQRKP